MEKFGAMVDECLALVSAASKARQPKDSQDQDGDPRLHAVC